MSPTLNLNTAVQGESQPRTNVYIPVHKRGGSRSSNGDDDMLSSSFSSTSSMLLMPPRSDAAGGVVSDIEGLGEFTHVDYNSLKLAANSISYIRLGSTHNSHPLPFYTITELLVLSQSPLVSLPHEKREQIRKDIPDIYMNRRQRQARVAREAQTVQTFSQNVNPANPSLSFPFLSYSQKFNKHAAQWHERSHSNANHHVPSTTPFPRSAVFTQLENLTQPRHGSGLQPHVFQVKPVDGPTSAPNPLPSLNMDNQSHAQPRDAKTPSSTPQRRVRRTVERRRSPKAIVDEVSWRTGVRQRTWSAQGIVVPSH
ncbi:hypothetical protein K435DRAFT_850557 [Dendrothele bispora CBS 962.96]|uniref:Uncharacterized protein n=1 Tax=Dendrothele bispora (strain CBS 962.96) TaxID=1314807 RepID=A0A4S8MP00_DENBC|nr:hypothetical protein K435DRAFT_850557 [Dendrothele bispora CBS 962.96]